MSAKPGSESPQAPKTPGAHPFCGRAGGMRITLRQICYKVSIRKTDEAQRRGGGKARIV